MDNGNLSAKKFWMDKINRIGQNKWFCQFVADPINLTSVFLKKRWEDEKTNPSG